MGNSKAVAFILALALCGLLAAEVAEAACDASALTPCMGAIMLGGAVTPGCCVRMRAQQGCLCQYARNPSYSGYVNSPRAQSVVRACGVPRPRC